jgi:hypothetical protein
MINLLGAKSGDFATQAIMLLLALELAVNLSAKPKAKGPVANLRAGLGAAGILFLASNPHGVWISPLLFLLILIEEIIGRVQFYTALDERPL